MSHRDISFCHVSLEITKGYAKQFIEKENPNGTLDDIVNSI